MNRHKWQQVKEIFDAALKLALNQRGLFLDKSCGNDAELRREAEKLLASFENAESFMEQPAAREVANLIVEGNAKLKNGQTIARDGIICATNHVSLI